MLLLLTPALAAYVRTASQHSLDATPALAAHVRTASQHSLDATSHSLNAASHSLDAASHSLDAIGSGNAHHRRLRMPVVDGVGAFHVAQIADVHLGEGRTGRPDGESIAIVRALLDHEHVDLAVLSGDQITGKYVHRNASATWRLLTDLLAARGLPHTALLGNHDAEPFLPPDVQLTPAEYDANQRGPGAETPRASLMQLDGAQPLSLSEEAPAALRPANSTYALDLLPASGERPLLTIYHLDTGGGGARQDVSSNQVAWLSGALASRRAALQPSGPVPPVLVYGHIPLRAHAEAWERGDCFGGRADDVDPPTDGDGDAALFDAIRAAPEVVAVFAGHDHCNDFCCRLDGTQLCYGRHSSPGGYVCDGYDPGIRLVDTSVWEGGWRIETRVRLLNGTVSQRGVLASSGTPSRG